MHTMAEMEIFTHRQADFQMVLASTCHDVFTGVGSPGMDKWI